MMKRSTLATLTLLLALQTPTDLIRNMQAELAQLLALLAPPTVAANGLQAALDNAKPGDTLVLASGTVYTGNYILRAKTGAGTITITSSANVPAPGVRVVPGAALATIVQGGGAPAISTEPGAHDYAIIGVEILGNATTDIVTLGDGSSAQNTLAAVPQNLLIDRCYIHGDPTNGAKRGVALNSASTTIQHSVITDIKWSGQDSQAVGGWNGPGPYTIDDNDLEASGENVMFGGADPSIPNLVPSHITITRNHVAKPVAWQTQSWQIKNLLELKNADTVTIDQNIFENTWPAAQIGAAILFNPRDQGAGDDPNHAPHAPWCHVAHVSFTRNIVRHVAHGFNLTGVDNYDPASTGYDYVIRGNLVYDVSGDLFRLSNGPIAGLTVDHLTAIATNSILQTDDIVPTAAGFSLTNSIVTRGNYGIHTPTAQEGNASLAGYFPGSTVTGNALVGAPGWLYPAGNTAPADLSGLNQTTFVPVPGGSLDVVGTDGQKIGCDVSQLPPL